MKTILSLVGLVTLTSTLEPFITALKVGSIVVEDEPSGSVFDTEPNVVIKAFVPSCVTLASIISYLEFSASLHDIKYFALRYVA